MEAAVGGQVVPQRLAGMTGRRAQADVIGALPDAAADLEQAQLQGSQLHRGDAARAQPAAQRVKQPVGGGVQQQAKLVGPEPMVTQPVGEAGDFQVLDPVFSRAAVDVPVIERVRRIDARGDDKAGVGSLGQRFGFDDHAARLVPTLGLIRRFPDETDLLRPQGRSLPLRLGDQWGGESGQPGIGDEADGIDDPLVLTPVVDGGHRPAAIHAHRDGHLGRPEYLASVR
ncbi:MAG: hypothetical protein K0S99_759 [Thermomicrobiales bacterium]|nr:hypothetical protein [Thermomicrobiales bacterium]